MILRVRFGNADELLAQQSHAEQGGLFFPAPEPPPDALAVLTIRLQIADEFADLECKVQVVSARGVAVTFEDANAANEALDPLFDAAVEAPDVAGDTAVDWFDPDAAREAEEAEDEDHEVERQTLLDHIRSLSATKKMQLARNGDRASRLLLMKDPNKTIHVFLVQNKKITLDEVRYLAGFRQANPEALKMISENRIWTQNPRILSALVRNPKTPSPIAVRLLERLPMSELRKIARSGDIPPAVSRAAKRKVLK